MISLNMRGKATLLALTMLIAAPARSENLLDPVVSYVSNNKALSTALVCFFYGVHTRMVTKTGADYQLDQWKDDLKNLLASFNIFDANFYKQLVHLFDKYLIGLEFKKKESTKRIKNDDGTVDTIKGDKVTQKPFGVYGYFNAYCMKPMKPFAEAVVAIVALTKLLDTPATAFKKSSSGD